MQRRTLTLGDGYATSVFCHPASTPVGTAVLYVHGIQSHPGWYTGSSQFLAQAGHPVFQVTRRGSGDNTAHRGDTPSAGQILDDIGAACRHVLHETQQDKLALVGVSWGGKLLVAYMLRHRPPFVHSLTLVAPGIAPKVDVKARAKLAIALALLTRSRRMFDIPLSDPELFTDNPQMLSYLAGDYLALGQATARLLYANRRMDGIIARAAAGSIDVPTTLILARNDRVIGNGTTNHLVQRLAGRKVVVRMLDGSHTLEFEPDPRPVCEAILAGVRGMPKDATAKE